MVTEAARNSTEVASFLDKPSPVVTPPAEKGSAEGKPTGGEGQQGKAQSLDFEKLYREDMDFRSHVERKAQSRLDKLLAEQRRQWETQQATLETQRKREAELKAEMEMDPHELGEKRKREIDRQLNPDPQIHAATEWGLSEGERRAFVRLRETLEKLPEWQEMAQTEREELVYNSSDPADLVTKVVEMAGSKRSTRKLEAELSKYKSRVEGESREEGRATEPSPDTGGGTPAAGDQEFLAQFAAGRTNDYTRAKRLLNL